MTKFRKILVLILALIAFFGLTAFLMHKEIRVLVGHVLIIQDDLKPVDVIHVIAGDDYRTDYAIQLYKQGYAKYIFFTGGWCKYHDYYHGLHGQERAVSQGVPQEAIFYDDALVTSTYDETTLLKAWIDQSPTPISSAIIVSDPFHMRRARWTGRHLLGDRIELLMAPVPFDQTPYFQEWWTDEMSRRYVKDEYIKSIYYFLRYQLSMDWLSSFDSE